VRIKFIALKFQSAKMINLILQNNINFSNSKNSVLLFIFLKEILVLLDSIMDGMEINLVGTGDVSY